MSGSNSHNPFSGPWQATYTLIAIRKLPVQLGPVAKRARRASLWAFGGNRAGPIGKLSAHLYCSYGTGGHMCRAISPLSQVVASGASPS